MRLCGIGLVAAVVAGSLTVQASATAVAESVDEAAAVLTARSLVAEHGAAIRNGPGQEFHSRRAVVDADGTSHVHFDRTFEGLPVLGGDVIVHVSKENAFLGASVTLPAPPKVATTPRLPASAAAAIAANSPLHRLAKPSVSTPRLVVEAIGDSPAERSPALAWDVVASGTLADGTPTALHMLVDAITGEIRGTFDDVHAGTGHGFHSGEVPLTTREHPSDPSRRQLHDPTRGNIIVYDYDDPAHFTMTDADDIWGDGTPSHRQTAAVDVQWGTAATYDFYLQTFGYTLTDNYPGAPPSSRLLGGVHVGTDYAGAYWDSRCGCMEFGDGNPITTHPYTSLDVVGHEATHSVVAHTARLVYSGESGGLNEATADIVGNLVEFFAANPHDQPDYLVGEKVWKAAPRRYMDQPSRDGRSVDCWSPDVGQLDVHNSSGVGNHAFYLLANGSGQSQWGNSPTCDGSTVVGIGRDAAAQLWFRSLTTHWTSTTNYSEARAGMLAAATELYGACGTEYRAVQAAWSAVAVTGADQPCG